MLRIQRSANGQVVFKLSGRMDTENVSELKTLLKTETNDHRIVLDLRDLTLVDRDGVIFLGHCEADDIKLNNCPAYIREWIKRERDGG
jgi:anti-anti-sigma regulatory factor